MVKVYINTQLVFEFGLKSFKEMCGKERILTNCRERQHFISESEKRKSKERKAKVRSDKARAAARRQ